MEAENLAPIQSNARAVQRESLRREQWVILILIVALTLAAWAYTAYHVAGGGTSAPMDMSMSAPGMASHMGHAAVHPGAPAFAMFVPMWIVMCFAMMLPTVWPMAFAFAAISRKRQARGAAFAPTWTFLLGYLIVWGLFGVVCWVGAVGLFGLLGHWLADQRHLMVGTGALFVAAGGYQLSPLKNACLTTCRHPLLFVIHHWREGYRGAITMGIHHGGLCVACCWALMVVLFPLGMMNLLWMGAFTLIMYLEKNIRPGILIGRVAGGLLLVAGGALLLIGAVFMATGAML